MKATVIIPVRDGASFLRSCLTALLDQHEIEFDVVAVDNGSSDSSSELIAHEFPQVVLERSARALGFAGAVNCGLRLALAGDAEVLVVLNQDTVVQPGWLGALLAPLARDEQIGMVGGKALFPDGTIQHAGGELLQPHGYGRNIGHGESNDGRFDAESEPTYLAGVGLALRRTMLEQIGLFDEGFNPAYFEDADLCLRARAAGWRLLYTPAAVLLHHEGAHRASGNYEHAALIERNRLRLALKHLDATALHAEFLPAEAELLTERARSRTVHVLRRAYLEAILMLPTLRPVSEQAGLRAALVDLRRKAVALERPGSQQQIGPQEAPAPLEKAPPSQKPEAHEEATLLAQPSRILPSEPPPVTIIMLTWNGLDYTRQCLESLRELTSDIHYQLIVVDNGSSDGTRDYLRSLDWVTLIENETNEGYVRGNNRGIRAAPADHDILLLNNDMRIIQPDWLARLRTVAHSDPDIGIVGCRLLMGDGKLLHAGTYMPTGSYWGWQIGSGENDIGQYNRVREVEGIVGACMYLRRDLIDEIGLLDERFFSYYEDTDYCLRAKQAGYKLVVAGDVSLVHFENVSTKLNNVNFWSMFGKSQAIFLDKWERFYHERYQHRLFWHSIVSAPTGYAMSSRQHLIALDRRNVDLRLAYLYGPDIHDPGSGDPRIEQLRSRPKETSIPQVLYHQGDVFHKNSGRYKIGYTMLEVTGIPDDWVRQCNLMDEVWVPSHFNLDTFHSSGVTRPIYTVPLGVDVDYYNPQIKARRFSERFTFLSVFEWGERKAPELLLRAYAAAFTANDDVVLVLKTDNRDGDVNVAQQIAQLRLPAGGAPIVLLYNQELPGYQMGALYRAADAFVTATRGEGWGMPILEAMACGLPTIATNWSAQTEFMREEICYPVRVQRLIPAVAKCPYYTGFEWAEADVEHLAHLMRYVYDNRAEATAVGQRAAEAVARDWTWERAADKIIARLEEIG